MKSNPGNTPTDDADEMRDEYDFRGGVRGKYAARYAAGTNVVLLDADVAEVFHDAESVDRCVAGACGNHPRSAGAEARGVGRSTDDQPMAE